MPTDTSPFHPGELTAQRRAGALEVAASAGPFIRDHMPGQHRDFFAALPFLVLDEGKSRETEKHKQGDQQVAARW